MDLMTALGQEREISDDDFGACLAICMELKPRNSNEEQTEYDYNDVDDFGL